MSRISIRHGIVQWLYNIFLLIDNSHGYGHGYGQWLFRGHELIFSTKTCLLSSDAPMIAMIQNSFSALSLVYTDFEKQ